MKLSIVYLTYRPGGIGLFLDSLAGDKEDYELIIIDDYLGRPERSKVRSRCEELNIILTKHIPSKPKSRFTYQGLLNAMNTGVIYATGSHILFCHDFTSLPYASISNWKKALSEPGDYLLHGGADVCSLGEDIPPDLVDDIETWNSETLSTNNMNFKWDWTPGEFELFYFACSVSYLEQINGFDERGDHSGLLILDSVMSQAKLNNYALKVNSSLRCCSIDHRIWGTPGRGMNIAQWRIPAERASSEKTWEWQRVSPNNFNLKELRRLNNGNG